LSGWLIRNANELMGGLTELYDAQAFVFKMVLLNENAHPLEVLILNRSNRQVH
jgi:hypothetical protein